MTDVNKHSFLHLPAAMTAHTTECLFCSILFLTPGQLKKKATPFLYIKSLMDADLRAT